MSKLLKLYEDILEYCSMKSDEHNEISTVLDEDVKPAMIEGRRLVMPTAAHDRCLVLQIERHLAALKKATIVTNAENTLRFVGKYAAAKTLTSGDLEHHQAASSRTS